MASIWRDGEHLARWRTLGAMANTWRDGEHLARPFTPLACFHLQVLGGPVFQIFIFHVAVGGDRPKHLDEAEAFEVYRAPMLRNVNILDGNIACIVGVHQAVAFQARQEVPAVPTHRLQVFEAAVPAVEAHILGAEPAIFSGLQHRKEMVVLGHLFLAVRSRLVEAAVAGQAAEAVGPQKGREADALDDGMMLAAPVAADEAHLLGVADPAWYRR